MDRRTFLAAGASAVVSAAAAAPARGGRPPNIVFVLADDLGWTDLSGWGSRYYRSPHLDRLGASGVRFTHGYSCGPNCAPTRGALLTGQYPVRNGIYTVGSIERFPWHTRPLRPVDNVEALPPSKITVAEALRDAGYVTGMFGKWHLGGGASSPWRQGFDEAVVAEGAHYDFPTSPPCPDARGRYLADFLTDRALDFIARHRSRPFFLYLPHFAVHSPHQAKEADIERFRGRPGVGGHRNPTYAAMIWSLDESVGRVLASLREHGLERDTLVIFSSDNGGVGGYDREGIRGGGRVTDNAPLRGGKGMLTEGGIRVPWCFRWPGHIPAGAVCDAPIAIIDLFPTLLAAAGAAPPKDHVLDGVNLLPCLLSGGASAPAREALYWHFPGYLGAAPGHWRTTPVGVIRRGRWKLMEWFEDGRVELYDLRTDPGERRNRAAEEPRVVRDLLGRLRAWRRQVRAPMPTPNRERESGRVAPDSPARALVY